MRELVEELLPISNEGFRNFVIDELHSSVRWAEWLRRFIDKTRDHFLGTDSVSAILTEGSIETGQARFDAMEIGYLNFRDFYYLRQSPWKRSAGGGDEDLDPLKAAQAAEDYLTLGGFPGHVLLRNVSEARRLVRQDIEEKAILKDLRRMARDILLLRDIFVACIEKSGSVFDATKWQKEISDHPTRQRIARAIQQLEMTQLLSRLPRYGQHRQDELRAHPKIYACDPGLVSAFSRLPDPASDPGTLGSMVETAVFTHVWSKARSNNWRASFFRDKKGVECDFVLRCGHDSILLEATASKQLGPEKARRLVEVGRRIRGVKRVFCASRCLTESTHSVDGAEISEMPLWSFLDTICRKSIEELIQ